MDTRKIDVMSGVAFLALTLLLWSQTWREGAAALEAARDPFWFPRVLLLLSGAGAVALTLRGAATAPGELGPQPLMLRVGGALVLIGAYLLCFEAAGYLPATLLFLPALSFYLGYRNLPVIAAVAAALTIALWHLFADLLVLRPPGLGVDDVIAWIRGA